MGSALYADLLNYGFILSRCIVVDGDAEVDDVCDFLDGVHRQLGSPEYVTTWIVKGDLACSGRLDVEHRLIVLGTVTCTAFVDHSDADFYAGLLRAARFASSACSGCDRIGRLETPYFFEWSYPQVIEYGPKMTIFELSGDGLQRGDDGSRLVWRDAFTPALHPSLVAAFADPVDYPTPNDQYWAIRDDLDRFIDAVDARLAKGQPILK